MDFLGHALGISICFTTLNHSGTLQLRIQDLTLGGAWTFLTGGGGLENFIQSVHGVFGPISIKNMLNT